GLAAAAADADLALAAITAAHAAWAAGNEHAGDPAALAAAGRGLPLGREAQRRIGNEQDVAPLGGDDLGGRGHAGPKQKVRIRDRESGGVGDDRAGRGSAGGGTRRRARGVGADIDADHLRLEGTAGPGIDGEAGALTFADLADIGLVDPYLELHLRKI